MVRRVSRRPHGRTSYRLFHGSRKLKGPFSYRRTAPNRAQASMPAPVDYLMIMVVVPPASTPP